MSVISNSPQRPLVSSQAHDRQNIISENHGHSIISNEFGTNNKRLRQSIRRRLYSISGFNTKLMSITQKILETRRILRYRNGKDFSDSYVHQYKHRVITHRFIYKADKGMYLTCLLK